MPRIWCAPRRSTSSTGASRALEGAAVGALARALRRSDRAGAACRRPARWRRRRRARRCRARAAGRAGRGWRTRRTRRPRAGRRRRRAARRPARLVVGRCPADAPHRDGGHPPRCRSRRGCGSNRLCRRPTDHQHRQIGCRIRRHPADRRRQLPAGSPPPPPGPRCAHRACTQPRAGFRVGAARPRLGRHPALPRRGDLAEGDRVRTGAHQHLVLAGPDLTGPQVDRRPCAGSPAAA